MSAMELEVRPASPADVPVIAAIFAHYVTSTVISFEAEPPTADEWQRKLDELTAAGWPVLVGVVDGEVVGYAYVGPWRAKPAYRHTVEDSVYLAPDRRGRGYGRVLLVELLARAATAGARQVVCRDRRQR